MTLDTPPPALPITYLDRDDAPRLAFRHVSGTGALRVFLPGYMSDMEGGKAQAVLADAQARGKPCLLLDYSGCGASDGAFADGTLERWRDDARALIDHVSGGPRSSAPVILIGSSMGGWLALLLALALGPRVHGLIGIAAAPDFTHWGFSDAQKAALLRDGQISQPNDYGDEPTITTAAFWHAGEANRVLDRTIAIDCPVRLLHGQCDEVVPWEIALRLAGALRSSDVQTLLIKDGDHRLSRAADIACLLRALHELEAIG